jgi:hypothetical protein
MLSYSVWYHIDLVWTDVSETRIASIFRVEKSASEEPAWAGGCSILYSHRRENLKSYTNISVRNIHWISIMPWWCTRQAFVASAQGGGEVQFRFWPNFTVRRENVLCPPKVRPEEPQSWPWRSNNNGKNSDTPSENWIWAVPYWVTLLTAIITVVKKYISFHSEVPNIRIMSIINKINK